MRKYFFVKSPLFKTEKLENACKGFVWGSKIPCSILVHDLCGIKVYIVSFRNRALISIASKLWTRMDLRGEWPSGLNSLRQVTEVKLGRVRSELWMGDLGDLTSQLTSSSFGRDVKLGVPCLDAACTMGLN